MKPPAYLGDGVYAKYDDIGRVVLTTGDHDDTRADNRIVLEPEVMGCLIRYVAHQPANDSVPVSRQVLELWHLDLDRAMLAITNETALAQVRLTAASIKYNLEP